MISLIFNRFKHRLYFKTALRIGYHTIEHSERVFPVAGEILSKKDRDLKQII